MREIDVSASQVHKALQLWLKASVKQIQRLSTLLSTTCCTTYKKVAKRIQHCLSNLRTIEKLNEHQATGWPNAFNILNSTMLNSIPGE